jgi:hypothetical protein
MNSTKKNNYKQKQNGVNMKRLIALFALGILFYACSENTDLVNPAKNNNSLSNQSNTTLSWLSSHMSKGSSFIGMDQVSGEQDVDLTVGGDVTANFVSTDGKKTISATLHVPAHALTNHSHLRFHMKVDNDKLSIQFQPHPTFFDIPLSLDLEYTGIDLTGVDPTTIYFAYLDDPTTGFIIENNHIYIDKTSGTIRISAGEIPHFSEYGFVRRDDDSTATPPPDPAP